MSQSLDQLSHLSEFAGRTALVFGLGRFGGGVGVARFLASHGARVLVADDGAKDQLGASIAALDDVPIGWHLGAPLDELPDFNLLVANPALKPDHPVFALADSCEAVVTSEIEIFCVHNPGKVIAVTGSNGKSTTASMIAHILGCCGVSSHLGGNIGGSMLDRLNRIAAKDTVVLELSSFQLSRLSAHALSPAVAVVTNFAPNHLDWHPTLDHYRECKQRLAATVSSSGKLVVPGDDDEFNTWDSAGQTMTFGSDRGENGVFAAEASVVFRTDRSEEALPMWRLRIPGEHNITNSLAAAAATFAVGIEPVQIADAIQSFKGLPYRLQVSGEFEGRTFVNDSSATTPESAIRAISAFRQPVVLIAGGADKGIDVSSLAIAAAAQVRSAHWMGATGPGLFESASQARSGFSQTHHSCMESAFARAVDLSKPGDIVILSPGCASFGMYANFEHRGQHFDQLVQRLNQSESFDE